MAGHILAADTNSDRRQDLLQLEHQLRSKLKTLLHAFTRESDYQRQALVATIADSQVENAASYIPTASTLRLAKVVETFLRASQPIVVCGPSGCGKSALIDFVARQHGRVSPPHIYKVQLAAETDARALLGSYHITSSVALSATKTTSASASDKESELSVTWLPGLLSVAVIEGAWLVLENIDCAPLEVLSVLTPVLDSGGLYIAEEGRHLHCAPGFRIFATSRTVYGSGADCGNFSGSLVNRHFQRINLQSPEMVDCEYIISKRFPSTNSYAAAIMRIYAAVLEMSTGQLLLTNEYAASSSAPRSGHDGSNSSLNQPKRIIKRQINLRDLVKLCQRLDQLSPFLSSTKPVADFQGKSSNHEAEDEDDTSTSLSALLFNEALDLFCMNISNYNDFIYAAQRIGSLLSFSNSQVQRQISFSDASCQPKYTDFCTTDRVYKHLKIGRSKLIVGAENMRKRASSLKSLPKSSIAWHSQTTCIVNAASAAVANLEPLLLVGETGTGKTSIVQYLAEASCNNLRVLNMSHYSESTDLIGGYKPLPRRSFFARLLKTIIPLIEKTFNTTPNNASSAGNNAPTSRAAALKQTETSAGNADDHNRVQAVLTKAFDAGNYRALVKYLKLVCERALTKLRKPDALPRKNSIPNLTNGISGAGDSTTTDGEAEKSMLVSLWREAMFQVQTAEQTLLEAAVADNSNRAHISFAFLEGAVVNALKTGEWLLLDEINLASSDALQCLLQLLDGKSSSLVLTERGDRHALVRHQNFRLFACMNPSTDVGKRDLEAGLRNRFTEIFVHEDLSEADLEKLVVFYMSNWLASPEDPLINKLVKFYVETLTLVRKGKLLDSTAKRPHFGIRSFCQALRLASRDILRFKKRSLYEALCLRFLTQLDGPSTRLMEDKIQKLVFGSSISPARIVSMLAKVPPLPEGLAEEDDGVLVENFWISRGALEPHEQKWFVKTNMVRQNLCALARAVALGRYPVLLQGETSIGKTSLVRYLAELTGNECLRINNHEHTDLDDYIGSYEMDEVTGEMVFREGPLVDAVRRGYWIILDELNLAAPDVLEALNRLLDDNRELYIAETGDVVKAHPRFMLFATQNPAGGAYAGRKLLSRAFRSRFVELHFSELPDDELISILQQRCSLPSSYAKKLVGVLQQLHRIRSKGSVLSGKQSFITMRDLFRWAERYRRSDAKSSLLSKKSSSTTNEIENLDPAVSSLSLKPDAGSKKKLKAAAVVSAALSTTHDWDQYLADHGYLLLAGRVRDAGEDEAIRDVMFKVFNRRVDVVALFGYISGDSPTTNYQNELLPEQFSSSSRIVVSALLDYRQQHAASAVEQQFRHIVWTNMLRRMFVLSATALYFDEPVLLIGGTGLGKTTLCQMLASWTSNVMQTVNCHMHSETADLIGSLRPVRHVEEETHKTSTITTAEPSEKKVAKLFDWQNGPLTETMINGEFFLLDEINLAEDSVLERINSVLETDKTLVLTEKGTSDSTSKSIAANNKKAVQQQRSTLEIIKAQPTFRLVATMNPGGDFGKRELSPALRNRFTEIWCGSENDVSNDDSVRILLHNMQSTLQRFSIPLAAQALIASAMLDTVRIVQYGQSVAEAESKKASAVNARPMVLVSIRELLAWTQFTSAYVDMMNADDLDSIKNSANKNNLLEGIIHGAFVCVLDAARYSAAATSILLGNSNNAADLAERAFCTLLSALLDALQIADDMKSTVYDAIYREAVTQIPPAVVDEPDIIGIRPFLLRKAPSLRENLVRKMFYYQVPTVRQNLLSMLRGMLLNKPILLEGPPGVGKTALVTALTHATGRQLVRINLSEQTDLSELFGADLPVESSSSLADEEDVSMSKSNIRSNTNSLFAWRDGPLLQALKCGAWILLDELNLASQTVLEGLNAVLDHRGIIYVPELNRSFHVPADASVRIFATQNPYAGGHGRKGLPRSFLNRFVQVYCRELMPSDVRAICRHACPSVDVNQLDKMVKFAESANKLCRFEDDESKFNLRDLLRWCQLVQRYGLSSLNEDELAKSRFSVEFLPMLYFNRLPMHSVSMRMVAARKAFDLPHNFQLPSFSAQEVHLNVANTYVQIGRVFSLRGLDAPFLEVADETSTSFSSSRRTVLISQRLLLQDIATCVTMHWPVVLSGKHSSGKRTLVRTLAQLYNKRLEVMSLNAATDTFELIGGFEQAHLSKQVENFFHDLLECCTITSRSVMYGHATLRVQRHRHRTVGVADEDQIDVDIVDDDGDDAAERRLDDMADHLLRKSFELLALLKQEKYLYQRTSSSNSDSVAVSGNVFEARLSATKLQIADEMLSLIASMSAIANFNAVNMPLATDGDTVDAVEHNVENLRRRFYSLRKSFTKNDSTTKMPHERPSAEGNSRSGFEWVDSPLLRAMKRGYWILLENVNFCNPAVLDRLNSVFEPDGKLLISERGAPAADENGDGGGLFSITPHPEFRAFFTVDLQRGGGELKLSRAMRNRTVELFVPDPLSALSPTKTDGALVQPCFYPPWSKTDLIAALCLSGNTSPTSPSTSNSARLNLVTTLIDNGDFVKNIGQSAGVSNHCDVRSIVNCFDLILSNTNNISDAAEIAAETLMVAVAASKTADRIDNMKQLFIGACSAAVVSEKHLEAEICLPQSLSGTDHQNPARTHLWDLFWRLHRTIGADDDIQVRKWLSFFMVASLPRSLIIALRDGKDISQQLFSYCFGGDDALLQHIKSLLDGISLKFASLDAVKTNCHSLANDGQDPSGEELVLNGSDLVPLTGDLLWNRQLLHAATVAVDSEQQQRFLGSASLQAAIISIHLLLLNMTLGEQPPQNQLPTRRMSKGLLLLSNDAVEKKFLQNLMNLAVAVWEAASMPIDHSPQLSDCGSNSSGIFAAVMWLESVVKMLNVVDTAENYKFSSGLADGFAGGRDTPALLARQLRIFVAWSILQQQLVPCEDFVLISSDVAQQMRLLTSLATTEPFFIALQQQFRNATDVSENNTVALIAKFYNTIVPKWCHISVTNEQFDNAMHLRECTLQLSGLQGIAAVQDIVQSDDIGSTTTSSRNRFVVMLTELFDKIERCSFTAHAKAVLDAYRNCDNHVSTETTDNVEMQDDLPTDGAELVDDDKLEQHLMRTVMFSLLVWCSRSSNTGHTTSRLANFNDSENEILRKFCPLSLPFTSFSQLLDFATMKYLRQAFVRLTSHVLPPIMSHLSDRNENELTLRELSSSKRSLVLRFVTNTKFFRTATDTFRFNEEKNTSSRKETDCALTCAPLPLARLPLRSFSSSIATAHQLMSMCRFATAAAAVEFDVEADRLIQEVLPMCNLFVPALSNQLRNDALDHVTKLKLLCRTFATQLDLILFSHQEKRQTLNFTDLSKRILGGSYANSMVYVHAARALYGILVVILSGFHPVPISTHIDSKPTKCYTFVFHQLDPALRQQVELELYAEQLKNVETKQRAHSILSQALFGEFVGRSENELSTTNKYDQHPFLGALEQISRNLRQAIRERQQNFVPYRPTSMALATFLQLKADISDYFGATVSDVAESSLTGFVTPSIAALERIVAVDNFGLANTDFEDDFVRWRKLTYNFIDNVLHPFSTPYNDLVMPLATGLHDTMDSLSALLQMQSSEKTALLADISPLMPLLNSCQTPQFYMKRAMQFLRPTTAAQNDDLTMQLLCMSSLGEQLQTSCLKSDISQARHMQSKIICQVIKRWTQACDDVRAKRAEQHQLFKVKHSTKPEEQDLQTAYAERDRVAEESDYRQAFPSYEKDYADLRSAAPVATRKNFGNNVESVSGDTDSEREQAVRALSQHEKDVQSLMTLSDRFIRFSVECDAFAHCRELLARKSENHAIASENAAFAACNFYTRHAATLSTTENDSALAALYFQASMLLRHSLSSNLQNNNVNFYHDADTNIALRSASIINSFSVLFDQLEKREELGGISLSARHPVVDHLRKIFQRILEIPVASSAPVQFAVGLQLVVESVQSLLQQIPRAAGLHARVDDLVQFLFELRKLELTSWQQSLRSRRGELENRAYSWYFRFYTLLEDETTALAAVADDEKETAKKLYEFAQSILTLIDASPLVEFQPRLFVLDVVIQRARWQQFSMPITDKQKSAALAKIINILINIFMLYKQYESLVDATIERCPDSDAAKAVKELRDYLKICRYDNRNFWAMRESIEKSRRLVHRCVRKYEVFLMSRALDWTATVENQKIPAVINDTDEHQQRRESKITIDARLFDSSSASLLRYVTRANEFAEKIDSTTTRRTELLHQRSSRFVTHAHGRLEKLQALRFEDLIDKAKMPSEVEGSSNNKEKKAALKQIKTERRRAARAIRRQKVDALHDLFAVLQHLGVSHRKGLLVSSDDLLIAALKCSTITAKTTELSIIKATNDLYYAVLADFGKFRARSMQRIADERLRASISPFIESMRGCAHHAMWLAVKQRAHIVKLANAVNSLERVDELLMPLCEAVAAPESNSLLIRQAEFRKLYNLAGGFLSTCTATINELSVFATTCYKTAQHKSDDDATRKIMADVAGIKFVPSVQQASTLEKVDKVFASLCADAKQICAEFSSYSDDVSQSSFTCDAEDNAPSTILSAMHLHSLEKAVILGRQLSQLKDVRCILGSTTHAEADAIDADIGDEPPFVWLNNTLNTVAESSSIFVQKYDAVKTNDAIANLAEEAVSQQKLSFDAAELNKKLVQPVMLAIESAYKSASALPNESSEDDADSGLLSNRYVSEIEIPLEALGIDNVVPYCNSLTAANKHSSLEQLRLLSKTLPVVQLYTKILRPKLEQTIAVHERTCATLKFSIHAFLLILQRGFCEPYDLLADDSDDENEDDGKSKQKKLQKDDDLNSDQLINEQAGIGDGIGLNDVSDQIKSEDEMKQLLDAEEKPLESNESRQEKGAAEKESDKAVEMKEHNFEGEYFDEEENAADAEDGESADKHKEKPENDEAHREMGELGDGLHDVLNDEIWSDDKEESEEEKNRDADKKPLAQESNAAGGEGKPLEENEQEQMLDETAAETAENQQTAAAAAAKNQQNAAGNGENAETAAADQTMADDGDENESDAAAPQQPTKLPETGDAEGEENRTADEITADVKNKLDTDADAGNDDDIDMTDANETNGLLDDETEQPEAEEEKEDADGFTDQSVQKQQTLDENEITDEDKLQALPLGGSADQTDAEKQNDAEQQQQNAARGAYGGLHAANETNEQQQNGGGSAEDAQNDENDANDVDGGNQTQMAEAAGGQNPANKFAQQRRQFPSEKSSLPQKRSAMPPPASETGRRSLASKNEIESGATPPKRAKILHADKNSSTSRNEQPSVGVADMYQHLNDQDEKPIESTPTLAVDVATQEEAEKSREQKLPPEAFDDTDADVEKTGLDVDEDVQMEEINAVEKLLATRTLKSTVPKTGDETVTEDAARTDNNADDGETNDAESATAAAVSSYAKRSDASGLFFTQLDNSQAQAEARERLLAEIVEKMNSLPQPTPTTENENSEEAETNRLQHAARLWQLYEQLTAPLARELCEQLRLVLEPTLRGKLRGDFRTGKRLNVRRIISYIASDFRKDKIWLRRAQPSKRHYQVMLAVDDSQSMAELKTRTMAFEALATLSNALTWLEVGELGVCKFGEQFEMLHELNGAPFTTESACRVLARCQFSQRNTRIVQLVDSTMAVFDAARSRIQQQAGGGGGGLVSQLLLIVSDGHNIFADGEERVLSSVRAAVSTPGVCIVYIVLRNPTHNVSVLDMKRSVFDKDNKVTLTNYMDDFPFPLYVILNDSSDLPGVLGDAVKQWFEMLVSEGV